MPSSTVQYVSSEASVRGVGVFILRNPSIRPIRASGPLKVGIAGVFPWGTAGSTAGWVTPDNDKAIPATWWPTGPDDAWAEIAGLPFGQVALYKVEHSDAAAAAKTIQDGGGSPADSLVATAKKKGTGGNDIQVTVSSGTGGAKSVRVFIEADDGTVMYDESYANIQASNGTVTDPGDAFVTFSKAVGASAAAANGTYALTGGTSGTLAASDFRAAFNAAGGPNSDIDVLVAVGVPSGILSAVNVQGKQWADANPDKLFVCTTPAATAKADAITAAASLLSRGVRSLWPRLKRTTAYSYAGYSATSTADVSAAPVYACLLQHVDTGDAAMMSVAWEKGARVLSTVVGLETGYDSLDLSGYADLAEAGVVGWINHKTFGVVPYDDVACYLVGGVPLAGDAQRYSDVYLLPAIAQYLDGFLGQPLDVNVNAQQLGPTSTVIVAGLEAFLEREKVAGRLTAGENTDGTASPAYAVDPFGEADAQDVAAGKWGVGIVGRKTPALRQVVAYTGFDTVIDIRPSA